MWGDLWIKEYSYLIGLVESHRNDLIKRLYNRKLSKKLLNQYLEKYDKLLFELYKKYEGK